MALLFMDSFDHYATADLNEKWGSSYASDGSVTITAAGGRRASGGLRGVVSAFVGTASPGGYVTKSLVPTGAGFVVGVSMTPAGAPTSATAIVLTIQDGVNLQVALRLNMDRTLSALRGTTVVATSTATLPIGVASYVEFRGLIDPSVGTLDVQVNGVTTGWITFSGNTRQQPTTVWSVVGLGVNPGNYITGGVLTIDFDDLYVCDRSGSAPWNTFLGDCRVDPRYPTAEGANSAWTPLSGTDNALMVDDPGPPYTPGVTPDDDTTYVSTATVNATDTHVTQDAPVVGAAIFGIQHCLSMKKSDAGACTVSPVIRHSSVDYPGAALSPGTSYAYGLQIAQTNPGTSAQWTEADFNAAEFGYKRVS